MLYLHYGCKVNQYETNAIEQQFLNNNYEIVDFHEYADIYLINTCTVTSMADKKSRQVLRRAKQLNPNSIVVVTGCYAQVGKNELEKIKEIDLIVGNNEKGKILDYINDIQKSKIHIKQMLKDEEFLEFGSVTYIEKTRAIIKVQDGCDRFCSYCIIPYARGKVRSRKITEIIKEVKELANKGIKEVVITGIHVASYGKDLNNIELIDLLTEVNKIDGIERIRLGSLEPTIITEEFTDRLQKLNKICHHFHLSLQSGNNETLRRMNRRYTIEQFEEVVKTLRKAFSDVILTTDIIVGFPGETDEEFEDTYKFLKKIKFYKMHIFKYSKRNGTKAAVMKNQIKPEIQEVRSKRLIELSDLNEAEYNKKYVNNIVQVLFEEQNSEIVKGHTQNYLLVECRNNYNEELHNKMKNVKIIDSKKEKLIGEILG